MDEAACYVLQIILSNCDRLCKACNSCVCGPPSLNGLNDCVVTIWYSSTDCEMRYRFHTTLTWKVFHSKHIFLNNKANDLRVFELSLLRITLSIQWYLHGLCICVGSLSETEQALNFKQVGYIYVKGTFFVPNKYRFSNIIFLSTIYLVIKVLCFWSKTHSVVNSVMWVKLPLCCIFRNRWLEGKTDERKEWKWSVCYDLHKCGRRR